MRCLAVPLLVLALAGGCARGASPGVSSPTSASPRAATPPAADSTPPASPRPATPAASAAAEPARPPEVGQRPEAPEPPPIRAGVAPPPGPYAPGFDALHYDISIALPDTGTEMIGRTVATVALVAPRQDTLSLDLTGLAVDSVRLVYPYSTEALYGPGLAGRPVEFGYAAGKLRVPIPASARAGDTLAVLVRYHGHPDDGLIIGPNVHGTRTIFADDWPNRARFWFPSIDHPSDKATVRFDVVGAPRPVVANGGSAKVIDALPPPDRPAGPWIGSHTSWRTDIPIPTYTMVIGAAPFVVDTVATPCVAPGRCVPVSTWLFPEDTASRRSFRRAGDIVAYFSSLVAPFPYEKLAHVESATRFGGMENASAIFYDQKALAAGRDIEETVAHETAHQWFGDSVTEADWHHLWLSEGFATYFAALYFEHADGVAKLRRMMEEAKQAYVGSPDVERPVLDTAQTDLFALLDRNSYQKGAWVLHMLRGVVGDSAFFAGIRGYYAAHAGGNALTADLQRAMERASGQPLGWFFDEWLRRPGYPRFRVSWRWLADARAAEVTIEQVQPAAWPTFRMPVTLELATPAGPVRRRVELSRRTETLRVPLASAPSAVALDPDGWLLKEVVPAGGGG